MEIKQDTTKYLIGQRKITRSNRKHFTMNKKKTQHSSIYGMQPM